MVIATAVQEIRRRWSHGLKGMFTTREVGERALLDRCLGDLKPAVLLLDRALLPPGVGALGQVQRLSPSTKILLFTNAPDDGEAIAFLKAGARGYHGSDIDPYLLNKAVQMVQKGEIWVGRNVVPGLLRELASLTEPQRASPRPGSVDARLDRLTRREQEVARLVGDGGSNKEVASQLNVTERTVKAHLTAIFQKLGMTDRLRLALYVSNHRVTG